jgi:hypothetical protein
MKPRIFAAFGPRDDPSHHAMAFHNSPVSDIVAGGRATCMTHITSYRPGHCTQTRPAPPRCSWCAPCWVTVNVEAEGEAVKVTGLPGDWQLVTPQG